MIMLTIRKGTDRGVTDSAGSTAGTPSRSATTTTRGTTVPHAAGHQRRPRRAGRRVRDAPAPRHGDPDLCLSGQLEHRDSMGNGEVIQPASGRR